MEKQGDYYSSCSRSGVSQWAKSGHAHSFTHYHGCFCAKTAELSSCYNRDRMTCKVENIYYSALYRKCLLTPAPDELLV